MAVATGFPAIELPSQARCGSGAGRKLSENVVDVLGQFPGVGRGPNKAMPCGPRPIPLRERCKGRLFRCLCSVHRWSCRPRDARIIREASENIFPKLRGCWVVPWGGSNSAKRAKPRVSRVSRNVPNWPTRSWNGSQRWRVVIGAKEEKRISNMVLGISNIPKRRKLSCKSRCFTFPK